MNTTIIILLCAILIVMVALEVSVLLRETKRHGRRCGARKSARTCRRELRRKWRVACVDWIPKGESFDTELKLREHVVGMPEPYASETVAMFHEAEAAAGRFASLAVRRRELRSGERRELRRLWDWLRRRGLLSLGFAHLRGLKWDER